MRAVKSFSPELPAKRMPDEADYSAANTLEKIVDTDAVAFILMVR